MKEESRRVRIRGAVIKEAEARRKCEGKKYSPEILIVDFADGRKGHESKKQAAFSGWKRKTDKGILHWAHQKECDSVDVMSLVQ